MIKSQGRAEIIGAAKMQEAVTDSNSAYRDVQIEIYSFSSRGESKNIPLVFKEQNCYVSFADIVSWKLKPENFTIMMGDNENAPHAENGQDHTGSYWASGVESVEHSFEHNPIFCCMNNEYDKGGSFSTKCPGAGFVKVHCTTKFTNSTKFTVSISGVENVNFKTGEKTSETFS